MPDAEPWRIEVEIDAARVAEILRLQFPELSAEPVRYLDAGWDSQVFLVGNRWVFKFPKRKEREKLLLAETGLLDALHDRLPLPIPETTWRGTPSDHFPLHFVGYHYLPGCSGEKVAVPSHLDNQHAWQMGEFLRALHGFDTKEARVLGIPNRGYAWHDALEELKLVTERLAGYIPDDLGDRCAPFLEGKIRPPDPFRGEPRLTHSDLQAEHILLDELGNLTGVIDFGDASIGDPAVDFVGLYVWRGAAFVRRVMETYSASADAEFFKRVKHRAKWLGLVGLGWVDKSEPARVRVYQQFLRNAFAET